MPSLQEKLEQLRSAGLGAQASSAGAQVYSTDLGRTCPNCAQAVAACTCKAANAVVGNGQVRVSLDAKGRGGKPVTLISGLALDATALAALAKVLKIACGVGGTAKDGCIEIAGDQRARVMDKLTALGHRAKRAGG